MINTVGGAHIAKQERVFWTGVSLKVQNNSSKVAASDILVG